MSKQTVYAGQSFLNKVVECTGDIDNAFQMMILNGGTSLTNRLSVGQDLKKITITDYDVVDFFNENNRPATLKQLPLITDNSLEYLLHGEFPYSF